MADGSSTGSGALGDRTIRDDAVAGEPDRVINQISRAAMELSVASGLASDRAAGHIAAAMDILDDAIRDLRRTPFEAMVSRFNPDGHDGRGTGGGLGASRPPSSVHRA